LTSAVGSIVSKLTGNAAKQFKLDDPPPLAVDTFWETLVQAFKKGKKGTLTRKDYQQTWTAFYQQVFFMRKSSPVSGAPGAGYAKRKRKTSPAKDEIASSASAESSSGALTSPNTSSSSASSSSSSIPSAASTPVQADLPFRIRVIPSGLSF